MELHETGLFRKLSETEEKKFRESSLMLKLEVKKKRNSKNNYIN